jgi:Lrp/AsnC family leucine-responsive transcriptional regulator
MNMAKINIKPENLHVKQPKLDEKDAKIVNLLNRNSRQTLKEIAQQVGLSIDGVKGRIDRMLALGVIERFTVIPTPKHFGYPIASHVYIKLQNMTDEKLRDFTEYLRFHNRVIILMSMVGDYDLYFVLLAKDTADLNTVSNEVRKKFSDLIADWKEVLVAKIYKYEEYQLEL